MKSFLRRLAFLCDKRANDSKAAYDFCVGKEGCSLRDKSLRGEKRRHIIMSRKFHYILAGIIDYLKVTELKPVDGIKSHFCFFGYTCSQGELSLRERSCYKCTSCFDFKHQECQNKHLTGHVALHDMTEITNMSMQTRDAFKQLLTKATSKVAGILRVPILPSDSGLKMAAGVSQRHALKMDN